MVHGEDYLLVVGAECRRVDAGRFSTESAFAEHVRMLRERLAPHFRRVRVAAPSASDKVWAQNRHHWAVIDEQDEGIFYVPLGQAGTSPWHFWTREALPIWQTARNLTAHAGVVHGGLAYDPRRPMMFLAQMAGKLRGCQTLFVADIDYRKNVSHHWRIGTWSWRQCLTNALLWDPLRSLQVHWAARCCSLVLLKSDAMVAHFGRGRPNVRHFWDAAHAANQIIGEEELQAKLLRAAANFARPLSLVYFGRLVACKGLDRTLQMLARARGRSGRDFMLDIIGDGDEKVRLQGLATDLGLGKAVRFHDALPYGPRLFAHIRGADLLVATPLVEDTPRSAFDAMAAGVPILAFDLDYYRTIAKHSNAVEIAPWPDVESLARRLIALDSDRTRFCRMCESAARYARDNTQEIWLDRRVRWTMELLDPAGRSTVAGPGRRTTASSAARTGSPPVLSSSSSSMA